MLGRLLLHTCQKVLSPVCNIYTRVKITDNCMRPNTKIFQSESTYFKTNKILRTLNNF